MSDDEDQEIEREKERERDAKADMLKAFEPLPEAIRTEIKLRVATQGGLTSQWNTYEGAFMEKCATVARLFILDVES